MRSGYYNDAAASHHHVMLLNNYRSHARLIDLPSSLFYGMSTVTCHLIHCSLIKPIRRSFEAARRSQHHRVFGALLAPTQGKECQCC